MINMLLGTNIFLLIIVAWCGRKYLFRIFSLSTLRNQPTRKGKLMCVAVMVVPIILILALGSFIVPQIPAFMGWNNTKEFKSDDNTWIKIPKAIVAKACDEKIKNCTDKNVILIDGLIDTGTVKLFNAILDSKNKIETVCLSGEGGYNKSAVQLIKIIEQRHMSTCLARTYKINTTQFRLTIPSRRCESACGIVFLTGESRKLIGSGFRFGVHNSGVIWGGEHLTENSTDFDDLLKKEHKPLLDFSREVPSAKMYYLSTSEANHFHVFSENIVSTERLAIGKCNGYAENHNCHINNGISK